MLQVTYEMSREHKLFVRNPKGKRPFEKLGLRCENYIQMNFKRIGLWSVSEFIRLTIRPRDRLL
jgi:hypothetical protein